MPGIISWRGLADGEAAGNGVSGMCLCGVGDGGAVGICTPGVITCGGEGERLGLATLRAGGRFARVVALFFLGALFGLGFIFDMSC